MSSETTRKLERARADQGEMLEARDAAAKRLQDLRGLAGLDHVTVDELARGEVPSVSVAAAALKELERRCQQQALLVQSLEADVKSEQERETAAVYMAKLAALMDTLAGLDADLAELLSLRAGLKPFADAPSVMRLVASIDELRTQYDVARGVRHSFTAEKPRVEMVLVDGESVPRAEWEAEPKKQSRGEFLAAMLGRRALD